MIWVTLNRSACLCVFGLDVLDDSYAYMMFASLCVYVSIRLDFRALFGLWESKIFDFFVLWGFFFFFVCASLDGNEIAFWGLLCFVFNPFRCPNSKWG